MTLAPERSARVLTLAPERSARVMTLAPERSARGIHWGLCVCLSGHVTQKNIAPIELIFLHKWLGPPLKVEYSVWADVCSVFKLNHPNVDDLTFPGVIYWNHTSIVWCVNAWELLQSFANVCQRRSAFLPASHISRGTFADVGERM